MLIACMELRKEKGNLIIADKEYREIQVITENNELIASITDKDVIEKDGYKVVCVPANN